jgi:hypothetical protein
VAVRVRVEEPGVEVVAADVVGLVAGIRPAERIQGGGWRLEVLKEAGIIEADAEDTGAVGTELDAWAKAVPGNAVAADVAVPNVGVADLGPDVGIQADAWPGVVGDEIMEPMMLGAAYALVEDVTEIAKAWEW